MIKIYIKQFVFLTLITISLKINCQPVIYVDSSMFEGKKINKYFINSENRNIIDIGIVLNDFKSNYKKKYLPLDDENISYIYKTIVPKDFNLADLRFNYSLNLSYIDFLNDFTFIDSKIDNFSIFESEFYQNISFSYVVIDSNFDINYSTVRNLLFNNTTIFGKFAIDKCEIGSVLLLGDTFCQPVIFKNSLIKSNFGIIIKDCELKNELLFENDTIYGNIKLTNSKFQKISFINNILNSKITFPEILPDSLDFTNTNEIRYDINLLNCRPPNNIKKYLINLTNTDLSKIKFNFSNFKLCYPKNAKREDTIGMYQKLLMKFKNEGFEESYKLADIEYKQYIYNLKNQWFINFINKVWWNYGYDKELIIRNSLCLFLLFFIFNIFIFRRLINNVYCIPSISKALNFDKYQKLSTFKNIVLCFGYSFIIFFGISMDIDKMNFKKQMGLTYLIIFYLIGLACNAFLIGYILNK